MTKSLYEKECIFLISVVIIHSSPMILNHGPVIISFDLEKCRRSNNCEALYSSNNINPTQLTIANIAFNAKSNKGGMIKLNTTQSNTSDKEINRNQTDALSTEKNKAEKRSNLGIGAIDVEYHNVNNSEKKQNMAFNKTSDFSNENLNNFAKQNSNLALTDKEKRIMNWHMKSNGDNDTVLDNKKEAAKSDIRNCSLKDSRDSAKNRKLNLNIENQSKSYSEINSNVIDNNEQVKNKLNTTTQYMVKSKIKTDIKKTELGKSEMLYTFKSNNDSKNNVNTTQLKATVNKYIVDAPENKTMALLAKKYYDKLNTHNLTSEVNKINGTNKNVTYNKTTNPSINLQGIRFNDSNTKLTTNIKNNKTLKSIHVNENNDTKSNYNTTQSTKGKNGHNYKVTINRTLDLINKKKETYDAHDHLSKVNGVSNTSNDKQASDFKNQTDVYEFDVDVTEPTTQFSADEYYKNFYNETDKIRKSAIDTFIELDKMSRSKRTQELEALLSRMVSLYFHKIKKIALFFRVFCDWQELIQPRLFSSLILSVVATFIV